MSNGILKPFARSRGVSPEVRSCDHIRDTLHRRTGNSICIKFCFLLVVCTFINFQVLNSLDAGATCIAIRLNLDTMKLQVIDNGTGMAKSDMKRIGARCDTNLRMPNARILNRPISSTMFVKPALKVSMQYRTT